MRTGFIVAGCIAAMSAAVWAISPSEKQQLDNFKVSTLKGLPGVAVRVKVTRDSENTLALLKESELQGEVEIALQNAGVDVLRPTADVGLYVVLVKVASGNKDDLNVAVHIQSSLLQIASLARDPSIKAEVQTWPGVSQARFGSVSIAIAKSMIRKTVKDHAATFAEDFLAANPKNAGNSALQQSPVN